MAVYVLTGKLGSGKTLAAVGKIRDALVKGLPVATNLNLKLDKLIGPQSKKSRVYRLPDKPTVHDMRALGSGNDTYDEEKNGVIVLDECGTWFNSRDWQDKERRPLIDWLLHARKLGWDIIFIIQDVNMIDKQARKSVCEHVVYCRRMDRLKIPLLDKLAKFFTGREIPKAKIHLGIVKYGDQPNSITVDRWWYMAHDLYPAYDTKQAFTDDYPHGIYQMLPPYYSHGRYAVPHDWRFYMRMTKIYLKRFSKVVVLAGGIVAGAVMASTINKLESEPVVTEKPSVNIDTRPQEAKESAFSPTLGGGQGDEPKTVSETFTGFIITGVATDGSGNPIFVQIESPEERHNLETLRAAGYLVRMVSKCEVLIMNQDRSQSTRLYTSYCGPDHPPQTPPMMTAQERYQWRLDQVRAQERLERQYR